MKDRISLFSLAVFLVCSIYAIPAFGMADCIEEITILHGPCPEGGSFGWSLATSGALLAVGDPSGGEDHKGRVYIFDITDSSRPTLLSEIAPKYMDDVQHFGQSVDIDGMTLAIGNALDSSKTPFGGAVHLFDISSPMQPQELAKIFPADPFSWSGFGESVSLEGSLLAVGAPNAFDSKGNRTGTVYLFDATDHNHVTQVHKFVSPTPLANDFGHRVIVRDTELLASAPATDTHTAAKLYLYGIDDAASPVLKQGFTNRPPHFAAAWLVDWEDDTIVFSDSTAASTGEVNVYVRSRPGGAFRLTDRIGAPTEPPNTTFSRICQLGSNGSLLVTSRLLDPKTTDVLWSNVTLSKTGQGAHHCLSTALDRFAIAEIVGQSSVSLDFEHFAIGVPLHHSVGSGAVVIVRTDISCRADMDQNGAVDTSDLLLLLRNWATAGQSATISYPFDITDAEDLNALLNSWGPCHN